MFPDFFNTVVSEASPEQNPGRETTASPAYSAQNYNSGIFVISIGGSLFFSDGTPDAEAIRRIANSINSLHSAGYKFVLVIGGGALAREYIEIARQFNSNNFEMDEIGINATRTNALLFIKVLDSAHSEVMTDIKKTKAVLDAHRIPVFGGLIPGVTTDFGAALISEYLNATFINLSNVDGIYSANPKTHPEAELYRELSYEELLKILLKEETTPGQKLVLDIPAAIILKRSRIPALFLNGNNLENFEAAVRGMHFEGTIIGEIPSGNPELQIESEAEETKKPARRSIARKRKPKRTAKKQRKKTGHYNPDEIAMGLRLH